MNGKKRQNDGKKEFNPYMFLERGITRPSEGGPEEGKLGKVSKSRYGPWGRVGDRRRQ